MLYIIIAILMFGVLIAIHEWGHFAAAKLLGVKVNEFAIGMGPKLLSKQKGETLYSLRAFPIGGYCAMEGEEEETESEGSFSSKPVWKKLIILVAGSAMNYIIGFVILLFLFAQATSFVVPVISGFMDGFPSESEAQLMQGDRILSVNGHKISIYADLGQYMAPDANGEMDLLIERDGETLTRNNFKLEAQEYVVDGKIQKKYGLIFQKEMATPLDTLKQSWDTSLYFARSVWSGLAMLVRGEAKMSDLSGPIGIVSIIGQTGSQAETTESGMYQIFYLIALIAVNLAIMNLLPIPALDGGRIFFILIGSLFHLVTRKRLDPKYEGYVHSIGFVLLLLLMLAVTFQDVIKLVKL
ncbi:MAG: M50 family metallopeptidase [Evtepia sp.]